MTYAQPHDRRRFLTLAAGLAGGALLSGCSGGNASSGAGSAIAVVPATSAVAAPSTAATGTHPLNLALNLAYGGAQFYNYAALGAGIPADATTGVGQPGSASGARRVAFADPVIARIVAELAAEKLGHVLALRAELGAAAAAQPAIDLSAGASGGFAHAAQGAGIVASGSPFDVYADDTTFLIGAFLVENGVAAAYRSLAGDSAAASVIAANLGDAIYHGGVIRSLLDARGAGDGTVARLATLLATVDGSDIGDQTLAGASGASSNLFDAAGRAIPFTRDTAQILKTLYLSQNGFGGFLPAGANGLPA